MTLEHKEGIAKGTDILSQKLEHRFWFLKNFAMTIELSTGNLTNKIKLLTDILCFSGNIQNTVKSEW